MEHIKKTINRAYGNLQKIEPRNSLEYRILTQDTIQQLGVQQSLQRNRKISAINGANYLQTGT